MKLAATEIKKMPPKEKLKPIEKLSKSVDEDIIKTEEDAVVEERMRLFEAGKMKFDSWENAKKRLLKKAEQRNKKVLPRVSG